MICRKNEKENQSRKRVWMHNGMRSCQSKTATFFGQAVISYTRAALPKAVQSDRRVGQCSQSPGNEIMKKNVKDKQTDKHKTNLNRVVSTFLRILNKNRQPRPQRAPHKSRPQNRSMITRSSKRPHVLSLPFPVRQLLKLWNGQSIYS